MIGHYLLTLRPEQEARVLTIPFGGIDDPAPDCLVTAAESEISYVAALDHCGWAAQYDYAACQPAADGYWYSPGHRYEDLCKRFGTTRINRAIRSRILTNQLWRVLSQVAV